MQGLAVVPLLVGYDLDAVDPSTAGRIVSYDVVGGRYEERAGYHAVGSGSLFAKSALKKLYSPGIDEDTALSVRRRGALRSRQMTIRLPVVLI